MKFLKSEYYRFWLNEPEKTYQLFGNKLMCAAASLVYGALFFVPLRKTRNFLKKSANKNSARNVFVFANGPSLKDIDFDKIAKMKSNGYDVIAINSFVSKSANQLKPDYVVFADNIHFGRRVAASTQYEDDLSWCVDNNVRLFVPAHYYKSVASKNKVAFNAFANIHSKNTTDITRPLGYYPLTALYALSLAKSLGYKNVYIAGFDNSYFKDFVVHDDNEIELRHKHYYDSDQVDTVVKRDSTPTSKLFFDFYRHFYFIEKVVDCRFINVSKVTYLNTIVKDNSMDIYK